LADILQMSFMDDPLRLGGTGTPCDALVS